MLVDLAPQEIPAGDYAVVAHVREAFVTLDPRAASAFDELALWQESGHAAPGDRTAGSRRAAIRSR